MSILINNDMATTEMRMVITKLQKVLNNISKNTYSLYFHILIIMEIQ